MIDIEFRVIVSALLSGFIAHRAFFTRTIQHPTDSVIAQPESGPVTRIANLIALPAILSTIAYVIRPEWMTWSTISLPSWLRWIGVAIALGGFGLLQWSQNSLGVNWSDAPKLVEGQKMVTDGPYRWVRHPIYSAFFLILGSLFLISANWLIGLLWLGMITLDIVARMNTEESLMLKHFSEQYRVYMSRTGRLFPRLRRSNGNDV